MSKLSFRARQLDASKPMPVFRADEIPDIHDMAAINRAVPQMPTGMEKEEEAEHHLQRALSAQQAFGSAERLVIPIPDVEEVGTAYEQLYRNKARDFRPPKQYIHVQPFGMDQEIPDYDMDSEDEGWLTKQARNLKMEVTPLKFENMMDRLEKGSGQTVVSLQDAKALLKEDDDLIIAVYDYWLNKRLRLQHPLIPSVKTEKRDGSTTNNPYVAFRRRTEKMQTRKNRKNDEASYEKMLKLRRDLNKALIILEMMKRREKSKKELLKLTIEIVDKRYQMADWDAKALAEALAQRHALPTFLPPLTPSPYLSHRDWAPKEADGSGSFGRKKREYRKRTKIKGQHQQQQQPPSQAPPSSSVQIPRYADLDPLHPDGFSSDEEALSPPHSDQEAEDDPDGIYAFKRKAGCFYHAPIMDGLGGSWPWEQGGFGDARFRYSLASTGPRHQRRCVGYGRRRVGRGGRVILDRAFSDWDDTLVDLDLCPSSPSQQSDLQQQYHSHIASHNILHFRPCSPPPEDETRRPLAAASILRPDTLSPPLGGGAAEFSTESFHSHQEQLLQMQQEAEQELLRRTSCTSSSALDLEHSFSSQPTSRFTLDSASAQFAASAVCSADRPPGSPAPEENPALSVAGSSLPNGPLSDAKSSCFSTSPAANVLQLNFPLTPSTPLEVPASSLPLTSVPLNATTVTTPAISTEVMTPGSAPLLKIASTPGIKNSALPVSNHSTTVTTLVQDKIAPMEVT